MKLLTCLTLLALLITSSSYAQEQKAEWMTDKDIEALKALGIDPVKDVEKQANYHWRYRAKKELKAGSFTCPAGSMAALSRNLFVVMAPPEATCKSDQGQAVQAVKKNADGSFEVMK